MNTVETTDPLDRRLRTLSAAIEPPRDLWPSIAAELEPRRARTRRAWLWQAAAAAVLVVSSSVITALWLRPQTPVVARVAPTPPPPQGNITATTMTPAAHRAAFGPSHALDAEYIKARTQLARMLDERIGRLPAPARQKVELNLAEMRRAADEINRALVTSPGDPLLEELLLTTYQEELAVLASVNQLATTAGATESKGIDL
jgi:hypothetical protein